MEIELFGEKIIIEEEDLERALHLMLDSAKIWRKKDGFIVFPMFVSWGEKEGEAIGYIKNNHGIIEFPRPHLMSPYPFSVFRASFYKEINLPGGIRKLALDEIRRYTINMCKKYNIICDDILDFKLREIEPALYYDIATGTVYIGITARPTIIIRAGKQGIGEESVFWYLYSNAKTQEIAYKIDSEIWDTWYGYRTNTIITKYKSNI